MNCQFTMPSTLLQLMCVDAIKCAQNQCIYKLSLMVKNSGLGGSISVNCGGPKRCFMRHAFCDSSNVPCEGSRPCMQQSQHAMQRSPTPYVTVLMCHVKVPDPLCDSRNVPCEGPNHMHVFPFLCLSLSSYQGLPAIFQL